MKKKFTTVLIMIALAVGLHMGVLTQKADANVWSSIMEIAGCLAYAVLLHDGGTPASMGGNSMSELYAECMG
jgi:preprotein translocase subunit SecG